MPTFEKTIAKLYRHEAGGGSTFLGTAFAFRHDGAFLTAAHCVDSLDSAAVQVVSPQLNQGLPSRVSSIVPHGSADVAVVKVEGARPQLLGPFFTLSNNHGPGTEIEAWGFPEDFPPQGDHLVPTRRLYKGTVQRTFQYTSHLGYSYLAGEMDIGAPQGLSGGPVCTLEGSF